MIRGVKVNGELNNILNKFKIRGNLDVVFIFFVIQFYNKNNDKCI